MDVRNVIRSQYLAGLEMLAAAVEACPDEIWDRPADKNRTWQVAYHAVFYVHFYLQPSENDFIPWEHHREHYHFMGRLPWPPHDEPEIGEPLSRAEIRDFLQYCREQVDAITPTLDLEADSGFHWLPMNKLELQLYSLRHTMQHVGELYERIAKSSGADLPWVGMGK